MCSTEVSREEKEGPERHSGGGPREWVKEQSVLGKVGARAQEGRGSVAGCHGPDSFAVHPHPSCLWAVRCGT